MSHVKVCLVHSPISCPPDQRQTVLGLGLKRLQQVRVLKDSACVRGMAYKVRHLVTLVETTEVATKAAPRRGFAQAAAAAKAAPKKVVAVAKKTKTKITKEETV